MAAFPESPQLGVFEWNLEAGLIRWSGDMEAMHGLAPGTFRGTVDHWLQQVYAKDRERAAAALRQAPETRRLDVQLRVEAADRKLHWLRICAADDGSGTRMLGTAADRSEQRRWIDELADAERWFKRISAVTPDVLVVYDIHSDRVLWTNRSVVQELGYSHDEIRAMKDIARQLVHPDDQGALRQSLHAVEGDEIQHAVLRIRRKDQRWATFHWRAVAFDQASDGSLRSVLGAGRDLREREAYRREFETSRQRYQDLIEGLDAVFFERDAQTLAFTYVSPGAQRLLGYPIQRWLDEPDFWRSTLLHEEDRERVVETVQWACRVRRSQQLTYRAISAQGQVVWLREIISPDQDEVDPEPTIRGLMIDITRQQKTEQRLREADRQKDQFLAMLGHELRNPLAAILSAIELLRLREEPDPMLARIQRVLERQTTQMAKLIDGLLDVSRIVRGKITVEPRPMDLIEALDQSIEAHQRQIDERQLELDVQVQQRPLPVDADRVRLTQIFDNLLVNAIKFTSAPGRITIEACRERNEIVVRFIDTGIGIEAELLLDVFEPFRQAHQPLDRSAGGLGLGLALVRGLVELHQGTVTAGSAGPGEGACFEVRLPRSTNELPAMDTSLAPPDKARLLVVEDNIDVAELLQETLTTRGHEVAVSPDAEHAMDTLRKFRPEVVLCDIGLPGKMNGYDLARAVRRDSSLAQPLLIALSGYGRPEDIRQAQESGFDGHLTKPVNLAEIEELLSGKGSTADRHLFRYRRSSDEAS